MEEKQKNKIYNLLYEYYSIEDVDSIEPTAEGLQNKNYIIKTRGGHKFVLKNRIRQIYDTNNQTNRERNIAEIVYEIAKDLPFIIAPNKNSEEDLVTELDNEIYLLYNFVEGTHEEYKTPEVVGQVAKAISLFHNESKKYINECVVTEDKSFENHISMIKNNKKFYNLYMKDIIEKFEQLNEGLENTATIIHADLTPYNVIFRDKKLKGIIDFDNIRVSCREEEVIRFLTSISDNELLAKTFFKEYQQVSDDPINLSLENVKYYLYKDLIEEVGIWYEKIVTNNEAKDKETYMRNMAETICRIRNADKNADKLFSISKELTVKEEEVQK